MASTIIPGKPIFESESEYELFCTMSVSPEVDHTLLTVSNPKFRKNCSTFVPMSKLRESLIFEDSWIAQYTYKTMKAKGDWLFPEWIAPCGFVALTHAYELSYGDNTTGMLRNQSLFDLASSEQWMQFSSGLTGLDLHKFALKLGISFASYDEEDDYMYIVGSGVWLEDFFIYEAPKHYIPVSRFSVTNGVDFKSTPTGLLLL
jgi:hypothetical protein